MNSIAVKKSILSGLSNKIRIPNRTGREDLGDIVGYNEPEKLIREKILGGGEFFCKKILI